MGTGLGSGTGEEVVMGTLDPEEMAILAKPGPHDKLLFLGLGQWDVQRVKSQGLLRCPEISSGIMSPTDQEAASRDQEGHLGHLSSEVSKGAGSVGTFPGPAWL